ncbi:protein PROCA1 isoform X2 [Choloepus didactylus]|uniref:protein PROCA1 isoform X2 n=1 Tax=Choloepus didactylus TaxID=27675 RepID=UPI0018A09DC3|nr:protein PROCA1 isoform X2 [Choloepus didactylus]
MWVRTTLTIERWFTEETECKEENECKEETECNEEIECKADDWGESKEADRCCWKHNQCTGHIIHPFPSDYSHCNLHLHAVSHCDCDSRAKECSEKANSSSSQDADQIHPRDGGSTCFSIIQTPCFELIPEQCVERVWYGWCKSYRPISVAVIHHPIHHEFGEDDLNEEEEEEDEEEVSKPPIPTQVGPATTPPDPGTDTVTGITTSSPDSAAPITIWRSESPTGKCQGSKVIKKVKKKKEKEKDKEEDTDKEKAKLKKKVKKGKLTKKKSPVKSQSSPPDLSRSLSPRELARMSESSPESREDLESEDSYNDAGQEEPSSEDIVESLTAKKREKNTVQARKNGPKVSQVRKVIKRKSPPVSNPNLS